MHFELLPFWLGAAVILIVVLLLANIIRHRLRERARRSRRTARRRKNIAQHRTWEWFTQLRKPKPLRLKDERKRTDEH